MGIAGYAAPTEMVTRPDGETFPVRALSLEDITILLRDHYAPISALFDKYVVRELAVQSVREAGADGAGLDLDISSEVLLGVLDQAPLLIADVIARAADEPEQSHLVKRFSVGIQLDAIMKVVTLTLEAEGGAKKLIGSVMMLFQGIATTPVDPET